LVVAAVDLALQGKNAVMATINRLSDDPYRWEIGDAPLKDIANVERKMPAEFITADGFHITEACRTYLQPLIEGEDPPPYRKGLPDYVRLKNLSVEKKLETFKV
jgi:6-phosphofructokinase 1